MGLYKKMYLTLFTAATNALEAIEKQNYGLTRDILRKAQQEAEEQFIEEDADE